MRARLQKATLTATISLARVVVREPTRGKAGEKTVHQRERAAGQQAVLKVGDPEMLADRTDQKREDVRSRSDSA